MMEDVSFRISLSFWPGERLGGQWHFGLCTWSVSFRITIPYVLVTSQRVRYAVSVAFVAAPGD